MTWQTLDFQGIVSLDRALIEQLKRYIEERESHLGELIVHSLVPASGEGMPPILPLTPPGGAITLKEGVEEFLRNLKAFQAHRRAVSSTAEWKNISAQLNRGLWSHVEMLEGAVVELFQQLDQVGFEFWRAEIIQAVDTLKKQLLHALREVIWAIQRLTVAMRDYRASCEPSLYRWIPFKASGVDNALLANAAKSEKFLNFRYQKFLHRYEQYEQLNSTVEEGMKKFDGYQIFTTFEAETQDALKQLYRLLKLWELNLKAQALPDREVVRGIRAVVSPERAFQLLRNYVHVMRMTLYKRSRFIKRCGDAMEDQMNRLYQQQVLHAEIIELHMVGVMSSKYRDFLLKTDPNPYVRARWGFSEWVVGPEPTIPKELRLLGFEIESLDLLYQRLKKSIEEWTPQRAISEGLDDEIQRTLHEMGQPLTSHSMMKVRVEHLLSHLNKVNELGACEPQVVTYMGRVLSRAMRADWKHQVLQDLTLFHEIYHIHMGVIGQVEDRNHLNRLQKFKRYIQQIQQWVKERDIQRHSHEIDFDINDIKVYLQDFLAFTQRMARDHDLENRAKLLRDIEDCAQQLLEYRYLFGNFFHHLRENESEEKLVRNQFLFVDQYFESVENLLHEMRQSGNLRE